MSKLTQEEATVLIAQAWKDVSKHTLGSYRFGQALWNLIPDDLFDEIIVKDGYNSMVDFYYEPNSDIVVEKFYRYFVEGGN